MVCHHAARGVMDPRGLPPGLAQSVHQVKQRFAQLRQRNLFSRPIVHFQIDVQGKVATPDGAQILIPDSLQVSRLSAGAGAGDQQVPPVMKQQRKQPLILRLWFVQALVGRPVVPVVAQRKLHSIVQGAVIGDMRAKRLFPPNPGKRFPVLFAQGFFIAPV